MTEITFSQLGWIVGLMGVVFGIWGQIRTGKQSSDAAARELATIVAKLDFVSQQVNDLRAQVCSFNGSLLEMNSRLGAVEKSAERAHVRLDKIELGEFKTGV